MGQKKSSELKWLGAHLAIQFIVFSLALYPFMALQGILFALLNIVVHGAIDWYIWRAYKLSAHKRILKEIRTEYEEQHDEETWQSDDMLADSESYKNKVKGWKYWEDHLFYSTIGFDQLLHILTIIALFAILI